MNRSFKLDQFLLFAAILLAVGFVIRLGADLYLISIGHNSAPFWLFLVVRAVVFLIPAAACLVASVMLKKRRSMQE